MTHWQQKTCFFIASRKRPCPGARGGGVNQDPSMGQAAQEEALNRCCSAMPWTSINRCCAQCVCWNCQSLGPSLPWGSLLQSLCCPRTIAGLGEMEIGWHEVPPQTCMSKNRFWISWIIWRRINWATNLLLDATPWFFCHHFRILLCFCWPWTTDQALTDQDDEVLARGQDLCIRKLTWKKFEYFEQKTENNGVNLLLGKPTVE